jgi:hypothetical protein
MHRKFPQGLVYEMEIRARKKFGSDICRAANLRWPYRPAYVYYTIDYKTLASEVWSNVDVMNEWNTCGFPASTTGGLESEQPNLLLSGVLRQKSYEIWYSRSAKQVTVCRIVRASHEA